MKPFELEKTCENLLKRIASPHYFFPALSGRASFPGPLLKQLRVTNATSNGLRAAMYCKQGKISWIQTNPKNALRR